jgi:putative molybdopterin biosynthesis protein
MAHQTTSAQIIEAIRREMAAGRLRPGDPLPTVRQMAAARGCAPGTVQAAYSELNRLGLTVSKAGGGTHVRTDASRLLDDEGPMRRAALVNRTETYLLDALSAGYTPAEVESAMQIALDRWRASINRPASQPAHTLRFTGSHEPAVSMLSSHFAEILPGSTLNVVFVGSLGGLTALAEGRSDIAGCHLWDAETGVYNTPYVKRLLPGRRIALIRLVERELCLVTRWSDMERIRELRDLAGRGVRFINRPRGAGTRVWLDAQLAALGVSPEEINGYNVEAATHGEVVQAVAEGRADAGLAIHPGALDFNLNAVHMAWEPYDLVVTAETFETPAVQGLMHWLALPESRALIAGRKGYSGENTGRVQRIGA